MLLGLLMALAAALCISRERLLEFLMSLRDQRREFVHSRIVQNFRQPKLNHLGADNHA